MRQPERQPGPLSEHEAAALRDAVAEVVLSIPAGTRAALDDDPHAYLRLVCSTSIAAEETSRLLHEAVNGARAAGHSWDTLGRLLGVSRQAAQQRFGTVATDEGAAPTPHGPAKEVLRPLTAFNEMAALEQAGRRGWHVVDCGYLYHLVEESPWQWEHLRTWWPSSGRRRRLAEEGWELIEPTRFRSPWTYHKRRWDIPTDPGPSRA